MKVYRIDRGGIDVWQLAGIVERDDALALLRTIKEAGRPGRSCFILDFEKVKHVDYRAFNELEDGCPAGARILLSGFSDYVLDIFAFVSRRRLFAVYPDWRKALRHLVVERGKLGIPFATGAAGGM